MDEFFNFQLDTNQPVSPPSTVASDIASPNTDTVFTRTRKRSAQACTCCRKRKVRCNVTQQWPCTNCSLDSLECRIPESKYKRPRMDCVQDGEGGIGDRAQEGCVSRSELIWDRSEKATVDPLALLQDEVFFDSAVGDDTESEDVRETTRQSIRTILPEKVATQISPNLNAVEHWAAIIPPDVFHWLAVIPTNTLRPLSLHFKGVRNPQRYRSVGNKASAVESQRRSLKVCEQEIRSSKGTLSVGEQGISTDALEDIYDH